MTQPPPIIPDDKDWTGVIEAGCLECDWQPPQAAAVAGRIRATVPLWRAALAQPDANARPDSSTWSTLEYGCHSRDVCRLFGQRVSQMLTQDNPTFANWDQDETAINDRYWEQEPRLVAEEYAEAAEHLAGLFDSVQAEQWQRQGTRSNGSEFTVATLAVYCLHDLDHHLHDIAGP